MVLKIKSLTKEYTSKATQVIESGLKEYFPNYDSKYNPDLLNLYDYYKDQDSIFLIGVIDDIIVVTGGLIQEKDDTVRIVRMSVKNGYRRKGYASKILKALEKKVYEHGYKKIVLETTNTWQQAISFYKENDYKIIFTDALNTHFKKNVE